jgi:DNA polymerase I
LNGRSSALKWILVACFGYQGFSNAKFGRIECHETINAFAREILLNTKERLEEGGWRVLHGIVDSIWVTPNPEIPDAERKELETLIAESTESTGIRLEHEAEYEWVAFVPQRERDTGALTKYFGKIAGEDEFKIRGIEARQRSTPAFMEEVQRKCLRRFDETQSPEAVIGVLQKAIQKLYAGDVDPTELIERNRVSQPLEGYTQYTQNVAALERARQQELSIHPGQDIKYVVVDDEKSSRERVKLAHETIDSYDASYYETKLLRAVESILSPTGWDQTKIRQAIGETQNIQLSQF